MSATNRRIIVWGSGSEQAASHGGNAQRRLPVLRHRDNVQNLKSRYSELTALAARLIDECRRLRSANDDLRGSSEVWIRMYERQLERANALDTASSKKSKD